MCFPVNEVEEFKRSDYVGKVFVLFKSVSTTEEDRVIHYVLPVEEYKKPIKTVFKVVSNINSSCTFEMDSNALWILNASYRSGKLWTGQCTGTVRVQPPKLKVSNYSDFVKYHNQKVREKVEMLEVIMKGKLFDSSNSLFYTSVKNRDLQAVHVSKNDLMDDYQTVLISAKCSSNLIIRDHEVIKESKFSEINKEAINVLGRKCNPIEGVVLEPDKIYNLYYQLTYLREDSLYTLFQAKFR